MRAATQTSLSTLLAIFVLSALASCNRASVRYSQTTVHADAHPGERHGPPPHAPAHGYRHRHADGVELVYSSSLGVYLVSGHEGLYFHHDYYYRSVGSSWEMSIHVGGPWKTASVSKVPKGLRKKSHGHEKSHKHGRG